MATDVPEDRAAELSLAAPPHSWWQFSLRTMFILVTLLVIGLAWFVNGPERQRRISEVIRASGSEVIYDAGGETGWTSKPEGWFPADYYLPVVSVELRNCDDMDAMMNLAMQLANAERVHLENCPVTKTVIEKLAAMPSLKCVWVAGLPVGEAELAQLADCPQLEELMLEEALTNSHLRQLPRFAKLRRLLLRQSKTVNANLELLKNVVALRRLELYGQPVDDDATAAQISACRQLTELEFVTSALTNRGVAHLARLDGLQSLEVRGGGNITDESLALITTMKNLRQLSLWNGKFTGPGVAHLAQLSELRELFLAVPLSDADLPPLLRLKKLNTLFLLNASITDAGLNQLLSIASLRVLKIQSTSISAAALARAETELESRRRAD